MAENDVVKIVSVETEGAVRSVKGLRDEIKSLRDALLNMDKGTDEYNKTVERLQQDQRDLNEVMALTKKTATALDGSYDALVHTMAELKKEWRATNDEAKRDELGKQILEINNQLKEMDASTGNFQRNVGDYKNAMVDAFTATGGAASTMAGRVQGATSALKVMSKTPIIAILGAIVTALGAVINGLKTSEENMQALATSMSNFKAIGDFLTNAMQALGKVIVWVVGGIDSLIGKLGIVKEGAAAIAEITKAEQELLKRQRDFLVEQARLELEISELRSKAVDKGNYSAQERMTYLKQAMDLEKEIADERLAIAKEEYRIAEANAQRTGNDTETNNALAESKANLYRAEKEYNDKVRELITQYNEARNQQLATDKAIAKEREEVLRQEAEIEQSIFTEMIANLDAQTLIRLEKADLLNRGLESLATQHNERMAQINQSALDKEVAANLEANQKEIDAEKKKQEAKKQLATASLDALGAVFSAMASIMEEDTEMSEKEAKRAKNLKIAGATISTITGAIDAYMGTISTIKGPWAIPIAVLNAATVMAAGIANINKIKAVQVDKDSGAGSSIGGGVGASVTPTVTAQTPIFRSLTTASEETRLNNMASEQRVYLVYSDVQAAGQRVEVTNNESSF